MKIVITYASAGAGHLKAAQAIYNYLKSHHPQIQVRMADILDKTSTVFRFSYIWGYPFLVRHAVFLWRLAFWVTEAKVLRMVTRPLAKVVNHINTRRFRSFIIQEEPDCVISTHFLPSEICASLKKSARAGFRLITVVTDFGVHPFWISEGTDFYIVASDLARAQLLLAGVGEESIKRLGIPVDEKFLLHYDRGGLSRKLGIRDDIFTVLVMTGSLGIGPIEEIISELSKDVQLLVVCAANKRLYDRLNSLSLEGVKVFGFVDNIHELMAVSDLIVTKGGGLTISEILNMELVPIFTSAIPGQEAVNIKVLREHGIGVVPENDTRIGDIVIDFRRHPEKLNQARENIRAIKKVNVLEELYNVICQGSSGVAG